MELDLTPSQAEKLNKALSGDEVDLTPQEADMLNQVLSKKPTEVSTESPTDRPWYSITPEGLTTVAKGLAYNAPFAETTSKLVSGAKAVGQKVLGAEESIPELYEASQRGFQEDIGQTREALGTAGNIATGLPYAAAMPSSLGAQTALATGEELVTQVGRGESIPEAIQEASKVGIASVLGGKLLGPKEQLQKALKSKAESKAATAIGFTKAERKRILKKGGTPETIDAIAEEALNRGLVSPKTKSIYDRFTELKAKNSEDFGNIANSLADSNVPIDTASMAKGFNDKVGEHFGDLSLDVTGQMGKFANIVTDKIRAIKTPADLAVLKNSIQKQGWSDNMPVQSPSGEMARFMWRQLQDSYEDTVEAAAKNLKLPELTKQLAKARADKKFIESVKRPIMDRVAKEGNSQMGLLETIVGAGAAGNMSPGGVVKGIAMGKAVRAARDIIPATQAQLYYKASEFLKNPKGKYAPMIQAALTRGDKIAVATIMALAKKDPQFKELLETGMDEKAQFLKQSTDPKYREKLKEGSDEE